MSGDLMTVEDFGRRYRVDSSVVRYWIRQGYVTATVVAGKQMVSRAELVKPVEPQKKEGA